MRLRATAVWVDGSLRFSAKSDSRARAGQGPTPVRGHQAFPHAPSRGSFRFGQSSVGDRGVMNVRGPEEDGRR